MNLKFTLFFAFSLLLLLIVLEYIAFRHLMTPSSLYFFLAQITVITIIVFAIIRLGIVLKTERNITHSYKSELEALSEVGKNIQKKLDISEERRGFLSDSIPQIVWECDEEGKVTYFNKQWYLYTGLSEEKSVDNGWMNALHIDDKERTKMVWFDSVKTGQLYEIEYRLSNAQGEYQWFLGRGLPMKSKDGSIVKWFGTSTNIEEQKNQRQVLEAKIRERTKQLQEVNDELTRSNKELENFAYIASHDLQEPLRKIRAFGDILKKKYAEILPDQGREYVDRMQRASYRMQKLIDDLLSYSRVSRNLPNFEEVDLYDLTNEVIEDLEETIKSQNASIEFPKLPKIKGDRRQLKQLFQNLISNGIKFHKDKEIPKVTIMHRITEDDNVTSKVGSDGRYLELMFSDNGIGFDEKYHDKIFTLFQRLHGRIEYEGTGIGLAICKKIVENHNGSIYANSKLGEGSEFKVILPMIN